jgi:hypothetical protein
VPRPGAIRSLSYRGGTLEAEKLSELLTLLLKEVHDGSTTAADAAACLEKLALPHATGRVEWRNLVKASGSQGRARSSLGDFVVSVSALSPLLQGAVAALAGVLGVPETTTGRQALRCLESIWAQAAAEPQMQAEAVAKVLPAAYRYVVDDADTDAELAMAWQEGKRSARVFARQYDLDGKRSAGSWVPVQLAPKPLLDDLDGEFGELLAGQLLATATHFGDSDRRVKIASSLDLQLASDWLAPTYEPGAACQLSAEVQRRLGQVVWALARAAGQPTLRLVAHETLSVLAKGKVSSLHAYVDRGQTIPVLRVTQNLRRSAAKIADRLLSVYEKSPRGEVATSLTAVLKDIEAEQDFDYSFREFGQKLDVELPYPYGQAVDAAGAAPVAPKPDERDPAKDAEPKGAGVVEPAGKGSPDDGRGAGENGGASKDAAAGAGDGDDSRGVGANAGRGTPSHGKPPGGAGNSGPGAGGPSDDADHPPRPSARAGSSHDHQDNPGPRERSDRPGPDMRRYLRTKPEGPEAEGDENGRAYKRHSDHIVKAQVVDYEARHGRVAESMDDNHPGYDIESRDPTTHRVRRIEVKGAPGRYVNDPKPSVTMSGEQFRQGYEQRKLGSHDLEYWLYVVDDWQIVPIPWTAAETLGFVFYAEDWLSLAVHPEARVPDVDLGSSESSVPRPDVVFDEGLDLDLFSSEWHSTIAQLPDFGIQVAPAGDISGPHGVVGQAVAFLKRDDKIAQLLDARLADCLAAANALASQGQLFVTALPTDPVDNVVASFEQL